MEHRCSPRIPYQHFVLLTSPRYSLITVGVRDLGPGGMFLETKDLALPLNTPISIEFSLSNELPRRIRLLAMVVRRAAGGVGIMFLEPANDLMLALNAPASERLRKPPERAQPAARTTAQAEAPVLQVVNG